MAIHRKEYIGPDWVPFFGPYIAALLLMVLHWGFVDHHTRGRGLLFKYAFLFAEMIVMGFVTGLLMVVEHRLGTWLELQFFSAA